MRLAVTILALVFFGCDPDPKPPGSTTTENENPVVEILTPEYGSNIAAGIDLRFLALATDSDDEPADLSVSWASNLDGDLYSDAPDEEGHSAFEIDTLSIGAHTITVTATDLNDGSGDHSILVNVFEAGEPPTISIVSPDSDEFGVEGEVLELTAVAADPDDSMSDLSVTFTVQSDTESSACTDEPDEGGVASCSIIPQSGMASITAAVTDPLGQTGFDAIAEFEIIPAEEHDGDGDGFAEIDGDCNDDSDDIHPDALELADTIDNDCDGAIDEGTDFGDDDGDGYSEAEGDCNDDDADVHPSAVERCNDVDDNCDGFVDDDDAVDASTWFLDSDGDGYGNPSSSTTACDEPAGFCADDTDCNDTRADINPGATEVCDDDDTDEDCDGSADGSDATGKTVFYQDVEDDGYPVSWSYEFACDPFSYYIEAGGDWDCDDTRADINPGMEERCDPFDIDENCSGEAEEPGAEGGVIFYRDWDDDGFGDPLDSEVLCEAGDIAHYDTTNNEDCCDIDDWVNPDATEYRTISTYCDTYDWNCDSEATKRWTHTGSCGLSLSICSADPAGWRYSAEPDCGESGEWIIDCDYDFPASCSRDYIVKDQECL